MSDEDYNIWVAAQWKMELSEKALVSFGFFDSYPVYHLVDILIK